MANISFFKPILKLNFVILLVKPICYLRLYRKWAVFHLPIHSV